MMKRTLPWNMVLSAIEGIAHKSTSTLSPCRNRLFILSLRANLNTSPLRVWFTSENHEEVSMSPKNETQKSKAFTDEKSPSQQIDAIIKEPADWRGKKLSQLRALILKADPAVVEEVKWKKPSNPMGVPVWSHDGIICVGDTLKNAVRLTFPKGAKVKDPKKLFNTRLDGNTVRAIDFHEGDTVNEAALKALILDAVRVNTSKERER